MTYLDALQKTLAAEHAAVYVYGYLGAQASQSTEPALSKALDAAYAVHLQRRDDLTTAVEAEHAAPVAALGAYALPQVGSAASIAAAALAVEKACAATYDYLVGSSPAVHRDTAIALLVDAAVRSLTFGGRPEAFPGR